MGSYLTKLLAIESASLIGAYGLIETSGTQATDSSAEANHGTYTGGVTLNNATFTDGTGMPRFDAVNDRLPLPASLGVDIVSNTAGFTFAAWCKVAAASVWTDGVERFVCRIIGNVGGNLCFIRKITNNNIRFNWQSSAGLKTINHAISTTDLFHVAITADVAGNAVKAYINGTQTGATQTGIAAWTSTGVTCELASENTSNYWNGWLSHAMVWKKALSAAQIADVYSTTVSGGIARLVNALPVRGSIMGGMLG